MGELRRRLLGSVIAVLVLEARDVATEGMDSASQASEAMMALRESSDQINTAIETLASKSEQIGTIVATITAIADQTNLLALNAAIEAARAANRAAASPWSPKRSASSPRSHSAPRARSPG